MAIRIVRLGSPRLKYEGLRLGTVRRPPRGVPKTRITLDNWYDVWLPELAPTADLIKLAQKAETDRQWQTFFRKYRREMSSPSSRRMIELLAALSHTTEFSVGCYCVDASHCHRSELQRLLVEAGVRVAESV